VGRITAPRSCRDSWAAGRRMAGRQRPPRPRHLAARLCRRGSSLSTLPALTILRECRRSRTILVTCNGHYGEEQRSQERHAQTPQSGPSKPSNLGSFKFLAIQSRISCSSRMREHQHQHQLRCVLGLGKVEVFTPCFCFVWSLHLVAWSLEIELTHMRHGRKVEVRGLLSIPTALLRWPTQSIAALRCQDPTTKVGTWVAKPGSQRVRHRCQAPHRRSNYMVKCC
jgi:hypothetical protein